MQNNTEDKDQQKVLDIVIEAIKNTKGEEIVDLDLTHLNTTITNHFVICHANTHIQVRSIAEEIEKQLIKQLKLKPYHKEGYQNFFWILLDYQDVIVHVFQTEYRSFYKLEELWADGIRTDYVT